LHWAFLHKSKWKHFQPTSFVYIRWKWNISAIDETMVVIQKKWSLTLKIKPPTTAWIK
jgi:hypothetical protein